MGNQHVRTQIQVCHKAAMLFAARLYSTSLSANHMHKHTLYVLRVLLREDSWRAAREHHNTQQQQLRAESAQKAKRETDGDCSALAKVGVGC
jgi:hypothetical protein